MISFRKPYYLQGAYTNDSLSWNKNSFQVGLLKTSLVKDLENKLRKVKHILQSKPNFSVPQLLRAKIGKDPEEQAPLFRRRTG